MLWLRMGNTDLRPVWRIIAGVVACQAIGGLVGLLIGPPGFGFMNLWIGAATGTALGFAVGLGWQILGARHGATLPLFFLILIGFACAAVGVAAWVGLLPAIREHRRMIGSLQAIDAEKTRRVSVVNDRGDLVLGTVEAPAALKAFAQACKDAEPYFPSHDTMASEWRLVIDGDKMREYHCYTTPRRPGQVICSPVRETGRGHFSSKSLFRWLHRHVPTALQKKRHASQ